MSKIIFFICILFDDVCRTACLLMCYIVMSSSTLNLCLEMGEMPNPESIQGILKRERQNILPPPSILSHSAQPVHSWVYTELCTLKDCHSWVYTELCTPNDCHSWVYTILCTPKDCHSWVYVIGYCTVHTVAIRSQLFDVYLVHFPPATAYKS